MSDVPQAPAAQGAASPTLRVSDDGRVRRWRLDRPARRNAIDHATMDALMDAAAQARGDDGCDVVVIEGAAPVFCAGGDLRALAAADADGVLAFEARWPPLVAAVRSLDQFVVAAIEGAAIGGGLMLALAADLRIAERDAKLGLPEVPLGWLPTAGVDELVAAVGAHRARLLILTGEIVGGERALELGLVDELAEPGALDVAVTATLERLASLPRDAVRAAKRCLRAHEQLPSEARTELFLEGYAALADGPAAVASRARFAG